MYRTAATVSRSENAAVIPEVAMDMDEAKDLG